jgi:thymidylate synthase (FAD)
MDDREAKDAKLYYVANVRRGHDRGVSDRALATAKHNAGLIIGANATLLDHGSITVLDVMGDDAAVCSSARQSYGEGTKSVSNDRALIRHLMRHWHTSPFEMCEIKLALTMPIQVARQWLRQRTASVNEYSGRFSIMGDDVYRPSAERIAGQSKTNKQASGDSMSAADTLAVLCEMGASLTASSSAYTRLVSPLPSARMDIEEPLAREIARGVLTMNHYTTLVWKIDLHNLLNFLRLRLAEDAQFEIRAYATVIYEMIHVWVPACVEAFEDYRLNAVTLSGPEVVELRRLIERKATLPGVNLPASELREFKAKLDRLGFPVGGPAL